MKKTDQNARRSSRWSLRFWKESKSYQPSIGLALSGGATRGMAHIGVMKALHDNGVHIDCLAGTSIGALVAALYAFNIPLKDIRRQAEQMSWSKVSSLALSKSGLLSNKVIGEIIEKHLGDANIEDAPIPLAVMTTDIATGKKVVLRRGNIARAVLASTCIPGIYAPIEIDGRLLVDGFLVENVPVSPLRDMGADIVLGVSLSTLREYRQPTGMINILLNAFEIAIDANTLSTIKGADVVVAPDLTDISADDPEHYNALFNEGHTAGLLSIPQIRHIILQKKKQRARPLGVRIKKFIAGK